MPRVATCKDCGARFKVPDSTTATRAKCKTCGGVLEIPPADGAAGAQKAAPAGKTAAPRSAPKAASKAAPKQAAAPTRKAAASKPVAAKAGAARQVPTKSAPSRSAPSKSSASGKSSGGARKGARKASGGGRKGAARSSGGSDSKMGLIVGVVVVVLVAGAAGWWFFGRDDAPSTSPASGADMTAAADGTNSAMDGDGVEQPVKAEAPAPAPAKAPGADTTAKAPAAGDTLAADSSSTDSGSSDDTASDPPPAADDSSDADADEPGLAKAPAPTPEPAASDPSVPEEPMSTLIEFEPLEPALGSTAEELAEWTALLKELYVDYGGATGRKRKTLSGQARDLDPVLSVPAYLNAINGVDINDEINVVAMYKIVDDWQKKVGYKPTFWYPADTTRMDTKDQNNRVKVLYGWRDWWVNIRASGQDQEKLDEYRVMIAEALREGATDDG